jgi:hypothetical protein
MLRGIMVSLALIMAASCGGGGFVPAGAPFLGSFAAADVQVGDLSFTATSSGVGGTGIIHSGALDVQVAISGNVYGKAISGLVSNTNLGSGLFQGSFSSTDAASGTFSLELITGTTLTGTWTASAR